MSQRLVLIVDDEENLRRVLGREVAAMGYRARLASEATQALGILEKEDISIVLLDLKMPGRSGLDVLPEIKRRWPTVEVIILTGHGSIETACEAMRAGAYDYQEKPCHLDELELLIAKAIEKQTLKLHARAFVSAHIVPHIEWGTSEELAQVRRDLDKVAPTNVPVLILGESGTGKELVAREIHARSEVDQSRFVVVNCGALPPSLVESTLFGHEKGSFTGALERKLGLFEVADGGTLFLDEIGELPVELQVKLLRFLQGGEIMRVGATEPISVKVRVIAATNIDIDEATEKGEFRSDLLYRLETIRLQLPPLRDRPDDVRPLVARFLSELEAKGRPARAFTEEALEFLEKQPWPGNVRELRHVVERLCLLSDGFEIGEDQVMLRMRLSHPRDVESMTRVVPIKEMERRMIVLALHKFGGDKPSSAKALGIALKTLYNKIKAYGIDVESAIDGSLVPSV